MQRDEEKIQNEVQEINPKNFFPNGFMADYLEYAEPLTDAPLQFHLAAGLTVLSASIGQRVWLATGDRKIYPNIWSLIIAPSSSHRKTTAINIGSKILREYNPDLILPNDFSLEAFLEGLVEKPRGLLIYSEFSSLLEMMNRTYMAGLKSLLTDIYDCPPEKQRKLKQQTFIITNPCISLLGASTIEWFVQNLREGDIKGGFLSRFLFFPTVSKNKSLPFPPIADSEKRKTLIDYLRLAEQITGEIKLSEEAKACYEEWYPAHEKSLNRETQIELLSGFYNRLPDYCLKFSILYAISVDHSNLISATAMNRAIALTEHLKSNIRKFVNHDLAFGKEEKNKRKIHALIWRMWSGWREKLQTSLEYSHVFRNSHLSAKDFKEALEALIIEKKIIWDKSASTINPLEMP